MKKRNHSSTACVCVCVCVCVCIKYIVRPWKKLPKGSLVQLLALTIEICHDQNSNSHYCGKSEVC